MQTADFPRLLLPMLAASVPEPFDDPRHLFQTKWDGVRVVASVRTGQVRLWGKNGTDYTGRYPELSEPLLGLPDGTIVDGEVVLIHDSRPDFHALMARHRRRTKRTPFFVESVRYVVFDMPYLAGQSLTHEPLSTRRRLLHANLPESRFLTLCEGRIGEGRKAFEEAIAAGHEGIVAKRLASPYIAGHKGWKKIKQKHAMPCVCIGYKVSQGQLRGLVMASLVDGELRYVGVVELGVERHPELEALPMPKPSVPCRMPGVRWIQPKLFCVVHFAGWRPGNVWRDAAFGGWK